MKKRFDALGIWCIASVFACAAAAHGGEFYLKNGVTDWSRPSSYCTDAERTVESDKLPGMNDTIYATGETFTFDSSTPAGLASIETISNVYEIITSDGTILDFAIPSGEIGIGCRIRYSRTSPGTARLKSTIAKRGEGTLDLQATGSDGFLYAANLDIKAGALKVAQGTTVNQYFGELRLASGATIWLPCSTSSASQSTFDRIMAEEDSVITNASTRLAGHAVHVTPASGTYDFESYVKGRMCGAVRIWTDGNISLEGTNNTMPTVTTVQGNYGCLHSVEAGERRGVILAASIGMKGEPSSLGTSDAFYGYGAGAGYRYTGLGEIADKNFCFYGTAGGNISAHPFFLDGGPNGGLIHTGTIAPYSDENNPAALRRLWLIGEHTNECVIGGGMNVLGSSGVTYPIYITKSGTGAWRLTGSRDHRGGTAIAEGTLRFDSIAERGKLCSLGRSTILTPDDSRAIANGDYVGYAFVLGGGGSEAIFEYTGEGYGRCTTRPLVLAGNGGHIRASAGPLTFYGISPRDANSTPTLTLDGTASDCNAYNITNGAAGSSIKVVKDGTGSWTLGGNLDIAGGVTVKKGNLVVNAHKTPQYADYKWFRVSIAQIGPSTNNVISIRKICLFNSAGVRQNVGLKVPSSIAAYTNLSAATARTVEAHEIGKGEIWFDRSYAGSMVTYNAGSSDLDALCNNTFSNSEGSDGTFYLKLDVKPLPGSPATWLPVVMHLPDSADPIAKFDIQAYTNDRKAIPARVMVETSHDGNAWEIVYSNVEEGEDLLAQNIPSYNRWISDGTTPAEDKTAVPDAPVLSASGGLTNEYFQWYRLRFAKLGNGGNVLHIRQIGLFDKAGRRVNRGLSLVEGPGTPGETRTILGTMPGPGQVGYGYTGAGHKLKCDDTYIGEIGASFNGVYSGSTAESGRCAFTWYKSDGTSCAPDPSNEDTWIPIVMHLQAPVAVHHFDIQTFHNSSLNNSPVRFMLEGSTDGETWHMLYNNATEGEALSANPTGYNQWLSDQVSASADNRPAGTGWTISAPYAVENPYVQFADGLKAQVLSDGVLSTAGTLEVGELTVDAADAGTIEGFAFAQNGVLNLVNMNGATVLPGTYTGCTGLENIANWTVKVNGHVRKNIRAVVEDGRIRIMMPGISISFR